MTLPCPKTDPVQETGPSILEFLRQIIEKFRLTALAPTLRACDSLARSDVILDLAVLGQFKSGKSSLLNALLGFDLFPVSALPATAVITRASAGPELQVLVHYLDDRVESISPSKIDEYVTETGNPQNHRQVAVVDVVTPAMNRWPGVRIVDTPGLGSIHRHNTETTRSWMPNLAVALVAVSAERPLSEEDCQLLTEARSLAGRVVLLLTKVDVLTAQERSQMIGFLQQSLQEKLGVNYPILEFSTRQNTAHYLSRLQEQVLRPVSENRVAERELALKRKLLSLARSSRDYLQLALQSAEHAESDRQRLCQAVSVEFQQTNLLRDELVAAELRMQQLARSTLEQQLKPCQELVTPTLVHRLQQAMPQWSGRLSRQTQLAENWLREQLVLELDPISRQVGPTASALVDQAEDRYRRVVEAFRDRLRRTIHDSTGLTISPVNWVLDRPQLPRVPVVVGQLFMFSWEMLSWILPMWLIGGVFQRHVKRRISWEVEKNLSRLVSDWTEVVRKAVALLRTQAEDWVQTELTMLNRLVDHPTSDLAELRQVVRQLHECETQLS